MLDVYTGWRNEYKNCFNVASRGGDDTSVIVAGTGFIAIAIKTIFRISTK